MKLAILKKNAFTPDNKEIKPEVLQINVTRLNKKEEVDKDGNIIIKHENEIVNLTRKINETAKIIKAENVEEKLQKLNEILEKGE